MNTDLPLKDNGDDKLGRSIFAKEIANGLVLSFEKNSESIVIGISGPWGSGKSTVINFVVNEIEKVSKHLNKEYIVIRFNPWMFSGQVELQNIFLKELYSKFESNKDKLKSASTKLANFLGHLNWLKYVHSGANEAVNDAKGFIEGLSKEKDLEQLKEELDEILIESNVKLYITIDDIDRLTPQEITDIFQLVKLNGNFANTIFILAYDYNVVTHALKSQFGGKGKKYLEKIVQVDYSLPKISRTHIKRIFIDSLQGLFSDSKIRATIKGKIDEIKELPFILLFHSLRDVYRFNNSLKLRIPSIYEDLNLGDFFLIEALRIFRPKAYEFIINNEKVLTRVNAKNINDIHSNKRIESIPELIDNSPFDEETKLVLKALFSFDGFRFTNDSIDDDLIREKRIANANYFDRYFNLQLGDYDIQEVVFENFINEVGIDNKIQTLRDMQESNLLFRFLNLVEIKSERAEADKIKEIVFGTYRFSDKIRYEDEVFKVFDSDFMTLQRFCSNLMDKLSDIEDKRELVIKHISFNEESPSFSSYYTCSSILRAKKLWDKDELHSRLLWHSFFSNDKKSNDVFENKLISLQEKMVKQMFIVETQNCGKLNGIELTEILRNLSIYHKRFYKAQVSKILDNSSTLLMLLLTWITRGYIASGTIVGFKLSKNLPIEGLDIEVLKQKIEKINQLTLDNEQIATIKFFNHVYEKGFPENTYYDFNTLEVIKQTK